MSAAKDQPAFLFHPAEGEALPVVFDSPHSGTDYPADFNSSLDPLLLRQAEDAFIDEIFDAAPRNSAPLLAATFPRSYIDPNRSTEDLDPALIDGGWDLPTTPGPKTERGIGLVWTRLMGTHELYDRTLTRDEIARRIESCWRPYHSKLEETLNSTFERHGEVWHVNCHSMPAMGNENTEDGPVPRAEFVLGDRDGTTCDPAFTAMIEGVLLDLGYEVKRNDPYKGVELVRRYSDPAKGRHSIQIEINRGLYLNEETIEKSANFAKLKGDVDKLVAEICNWAKARG
ncbi:N-formylglutamate amidohydrolase [Rhodovibrionaceae bacterium A322]